MTPEQRLDRTERILRLMIRSGRRSRSEWGERVNILIGMHERNGAEWRAESQATNEKINMLIQAQTETTEQIKGLAVAQAELTQSQKLTDEALRSFINSLNRGENGRSSN